MFDVAGNLVYNCKNGHYLHSSTHAINALAEMKYLIAPHSIVTLYRSNFSRELNFSDSWPISETKNLELLE